MKKNILILLGIAIIFTLAYLYDVSSEPEFKKRETTTEASDEGFNTIVKAPDFTFATTAIDYLREQHAGNFHDLERKVVLLNFWASWCIPCVKEFPAMMRLMDHFNGKMAFVAISLDHEKEHIEYFLRLLSQKYEKQLKSENLFLVWDKDKKISQDTFNTVRIPETIMIDTKMMMRRKIVGNSVEWDSNALKKYVQDLLDEK